MDTPIQYNEAQLLDQPGQDCQQPSFDSMWNSVEVASPCALPLPRDRFHVIDPKQFAFIESTIENFLLYH
jgi:hypothetical protein